MLADDDELPALIDDVAGQYALGPLTGYCRNPHAWGGRMVCTFQTVQGTYLLKEYPWFARSDEQIAFNLAVQDWARAMHLPVPRVLPLRSGGRVLHRGDQRFFVQRCVGEAYTQGNRAQLLEAARTLGRLHAALRSFPPDLLERYVAPRPRASGDQVARQHFARAARDMVANATDDAERAALQSVHGQIEAALVAASNRDCVIRCVTDEMVLHGDYQQYNLRFAGEQIVAIVDWDAARVGPRILEVGSALVAALGFDWDQEYARDRVWRRPVPMDLAQVRRWLAAYEEGGTKLSDDERDALPGGCVLAMGAFIAGCYQQPYPTSEDIKQPTDVEGCRNVLAWMKAVAG